MSNNSSSNGRTVVNNTLGFGWLSWFIRIFFAFVGYNINTHLGSNIPLFWAIVDFIFWPLAVIKWLICQQIHMSNIREAFGFFFN